MFRTARRLLTRSLLPTFLLFSLMPGPAVRAETQTAASVFAQLENRYQLAIHYQNIANDFYSDWRLPPISARVEAVKPEDLPALQKILDEALSAYPPTVIKSNLKLIGLAQRIYFYQELYGATYAYYEATDEGPVKSDVFLAAFSDEKDFDMHTYVLDSFHHEFSSILMRNYPFPEKAWRAANPKTFVYVHENAEIPGLEALKEGHYNDTSEELYQGGFLTQYATSSLEEDFNIFTGMAFSQPEATLKLAAKYATVRRKLQLWREYYLSIDPAFAKTRIFEYYASQPLKP